MSIQNNQWVVPEFTMGDRLRKAREAIGAGVDEFADAIGVSRNTITNYERDHVTPRKVVLNAWVLHTGVPMSWIKTGIAPSPSPSDDGNEAIDQSVRSKGFEPPTFWLGVNQRHLSAA